MRESGATSGNLLHRPARGTSRIGIRLSTRAAGLYGRSARYPRSHWRAEDTASNVADAVQVGGSNCRCGTSGSRVAWGPGWGGTPGFDFRSLGASTTLRCRGSSDALPPLLGKQGNRILRIYPDQVRYYGRASLKILPGRIAPCNAKFPDFWGLIKNTRRLRIRRGVAAPEKCIHP
jgi:hypothetical protein